MKRLMPARSVLPFTAPPHIDVLEPAGSCGPEAPGPIRAIRAGGGRLPATARRALPSEPLLRNGHLLTFSSLVTSVFGAGYWALAARFFSPATLGRNYSAIAAMMLLSGIGQLNLTNVLVRFVPAAGRRTRSLVLRAYLAAIATTVPLATAFVLLLPEISPGLVFLHSPLPGAGFVLATAGYGLFTIQDGVLTGLRRPDWVVLENAIFAAVKIAAVAVFALAAISGGVLLSWALALIAAIAVTNAFLFTRAIPRHESPATALDRSRRTAPAAPGNRGSAPTLGYVVCDYIGSLFWFAATTLPPLIVLDRSGPAEAAYFSLAWVIAYVLFLISANMGSSLVVESAADPAQLARNCRCVLSHTGVLLAACTLVLTATAPEILGVFGADYAANGTGLLRLLLISALPNLVVATAVSVCRAQRRMRAVIAILSILCCLTLGLILLLVPIMGIAGAGAAWLIAETAVATGLLCRRTLWITAGATTGTERMPLTARARAAGRRLARLLARPADRRLGRRLSRAAQPGCRADIQWGSRRLSDILIVRATGDLDLVIKHPSSAQGRQTLLRQCDNLRVLAADERLGDWRRLLPRVVSCDLHGPLPLVAEECRPGVSASMLIRRHPDAARQIADAALTAISELHRATGVIETVGESQLGRWVDAPLADLRRELRLCNTGWGAAALETLRGRLHDGFVGRRILVSWTHGDFAPGNVIMSEDGRQVTGIVDWATARPDGPAPADGQLFRLALRRETRGQELGAVLVQALRGEIQLDAEPGPATDGATRVGEDALLLLAWLRHVTDNINQAARYRSSWTWLARNVVAVLREVGEA